MMPGLAGLKGQSSTKQSGVQNVEWLRFRVQGSGFRVQGSRFRVHGSGFTVQGSRFRVHGSGFTVQGSRFRVHGSGFRVHGSGFTVQGSRFRVQGSGLVLLPHINIFKPFNLYSIPKPGTLNLPTCVVIKFLPPPLFIRPRAR